MRAAFIFRLRIILACVILGALVLIGRLYVIQIVQGETYSALGERQYVRSNEHLYDRGTIFFKDKDGRLVAGATVKAGYLLAIDPTRLTEPEETYRKLSTIIPIERSDFFMRAEKKKDPYEEIAHQVEEEDATQIEELGLGGVNLYREYWRFYPGGELAAHTLGFEGYAGDERRGLYGVERYYNDVLSRDDQKLNVNFFAEIFSNVGEALFDEETPRAGDVVTSIEPSVQGMLEDTLREVEETYQSAHTGGIVINPQTGAIYAMAVRPTFNLNNYSDSPSVSVFSNPLVERVYEMGSIIKPITMAIGLDAGAVTPETTYNDTGFREFDGYRISNYDGRGRGVVPMQEVLSQSLNTGVAFIVEQVGTKRFAQYMKEFGFGEETGIDLPNETAGLISNLDSPRTIEYATASYGQGIALTPIATVRALSALANGGVLVTPHVAQELRYESGVTREVSFGDEQHVISQTAAEELTRMLVEVVDSALRNGTVALPHYSIAAKTGTAQIARSDARGYYSDRYLHSFFGYFPAYDPQFLVFLYTVEPQGVSYASETLTDPFMDIAKFLISYYNVPPDR